MRFKTWTLRCLVVLLVAVVLFAAILHHGTAPVAVILAPILFFSQLAIIISFPRFDSYAVLPIPPALPLLAPRPPPIS